MLSIGIVAAAWIALMVIDDDYPYYFVVSIIIIIIGPHGSIRYMRPIAADGVAWSVSLTVMTVSPAAGLNRSWWHFGVDSVVPKGSGITWGPRSPHVKGRFWGRKAAGPGQWLCGVMAWLSVWDKVQMICIWPNWCHCHPVVSCCIKIQIGLTFLVLAYTGHPRKEAIKRVSVFAVVITFCTAVVDEFVIKPSYGCSTRRWHGETLQNTAAWWWWFFYCTPCYVYDDSKPSRTLQPWFWWTLYEPAQSMYTGRYLLDYRLLLSPLSVCLSNCLCLSDCLCLSVSLYVWLPVVVLCKGYMRNFDWCISLRTYWPKY